MSELIKVLDKLVTTTINVIQRLISDPGKELRQFFATTTCRWIIVGGIFTVINTGLLYILVDRCNMALSQATIFSAEISTILRFFVNDWWVFQQRGFLLKKLFQFHLANAGSSIIWWIAANFLAYVGINYLIASVGAVFVSIIFSFISNFFWVWRKPFELIKHETE